MPVVFNLRHLDEKNVRLKGEISPEELEIGGLDELIHVPGALAYDIELQKMEQAVLAQGTLSVTLQCECARCLKPYGHPLKVEHWAVHLPLEGEDKVLAVSDCVDLTPYIREDIVLAFPQHPLCDPECRGLASAQKKLGKKAGADAKANAAATAWAELDKLKLRN